MPPTACIGPMVSILFNLMKTLIRVEQGTCMGGVK
jgi:hypothetical protein